MNRKFLYIDVGDTLIKLRYSVSDMYAEVLEEHGFLKSTEKEDIHKHFKLAWREASSNLPVNHVDRYYAHPKGHIGWWRDLIDSFLFRIAGTKIDSENIYEKIFKKFDEPGNWVVDSTFFELVDYLKEKQIGLGIISNWDLRLRALLENLNLISYFEHVIISAEFGYEKPSPKIFQEGMRLTKLSPQSHYYVGDKLDYDYYPPESLGWKSFWISKENRVGIRKVERLGDLSRFIE